MKKLMAIVIVAATIDAFAGDWFPVASGHPGEPVNVHVMHDETTVQICPPRVERRHCHRHNGGIVGAVLGAIFGERCHYDYPQTIVMDAQPAVMVAAAPCHAPPAVVAAPYCAPACCSVETPTYSKRVVEGHYIDQYVNGRVVKIWIPAREEWVCVR